RVVWRIVQDEVGDFRVEVAKVWAVGYRKDSEVYAEINQRVADAESSPKTGALGEVLELFDKQAHDLTATLEPEAPETVRALGVAAPLVCVREFLRCLCRFVRRPCRGQRIQRSL